jgi:hypothetical protein
VSQVDVGLAGMSRKCKGTLISLFESGVELLSEKSSPKPSQKKRKVEKASAAAAPPGGLPLTPPRTPNVAQSPVQLDEIIADACSNTPFYPQKSVFYRLQVLAARHTGLGEVTMQVSDGVSWVFMSCPQSSGLSVQMTALDDVVMVAEIEFARLRVPISGDDTPFVVLSFADVSPLLHRPWVQVGDPDYMEVDMSDGGGSGGGGGDGWPGRDDPTCSGMCRYLWERDVDSRNQDGTWSGAERVARTLADTGMCILESAPLRTLQQIWPTYPKMFKNGNTLRALLTPCTDSKAGAALLSLACFASCHIFSRVVANYKRVVIACELCNFNCELARADHLGLVAVCTGSSLM